MALGDDTSFRVFLRRQDSAASAENKEFSVRRSTPLKRFLKEGGSALGFRANYCYRLDVEGTLEEVRHVEELCPDDVIVLSANKAVPAAHPAGADFAAGGAHMGDPAAAAAVEGKGSATAGAAAAAAAAAAAEPEEIQLSILGSGGVGKSSLTLRYVRDYFAEGWDPTIEDRYTRVANVDGVDANVRILDTAGQEQFNSMHHRWMEGKDALVFAFALDSERSFEELEACITSYVTWVRPRGVPVILVGNKKDRVDMNPGCREVSTEAAKKKAEEIGAVSYVETSARTAENVQFLFHTLVRIVRQQKKQEEEEEMRKSRKCANMKCAIL